MSRRHRHRSARRVLLGFVAASALLLQLVPTSLAAPSGTVTGVLDVEGALTGEGALTAAAVAVVTIVDEGAGSAEPLIVGQQRGPVQGAGPLPFAVRYDPARIDPERPYLLYASIVDGEAVLQSTAPVPVITGRSGDGPGRADGAPPRRRGDPHHLGHEEGRDQPERRSGRAGGRGEGGRRPPGRPRHLGRARPGASGARDPVRPGPGRPLRAVHGEGRHHRWRERVGEPRLGGRSCPGRRTP